MSLKRGKIGQRLLLWTNRKLHTRFRLVPKSATSDDLEDHALHSQHMRFSELTTKILMKIDINYQQRRCSVVTVVSGHIRFMRIFVGVPWRGDAKRQWGNRKHRFSGLSDAASTAR